MGSAQAKVDFGLSTGELSPVLIAAHELKSPLALIRQLTLELQHYQLSEAEQTKLIEHILFTSERSLDLVSSLTKSARLEDSLFDTETINLLAVCEQVAHDMTPLYKSYGRNIEVAKRQRPLMAVANRDLLHRVVRQFADNALHYGSADTPVFLSVSMNHDNARIAVRDYGPAVCQTPWDKTNPVQQMSQRPESSGLGLVIAQKFAAAMDGQVGVTRHRDGASFYIDMIRSRQLSLV